MPSMCFMLFPEQMHGRFEVDKCLAREQAPYTFEVLDALVLSPV